MMKVCLFLNYLTLYNILNLYINTAIKFDRNICSNMFIDSELLGCKKVLFSLISIELFYLAVIILQEPD